VAGSTTQQAKAGSDSDASQTASAQDRARARLLVVRHLTAQHVLLRTNVCNCWDKPGNFGQTVLNLLLWGYGWSTSSSSANPKPCFSGGRLGWLVSLQHCGLRGGRAFRGLTRSPTRHDGSFWSNCRQQINQRDGPYLYMHYLKTSEAAGLLNVSSNTLRQWEARFDFPKPQRSPGGHRMYMHCEVAALREALYDGLSVSSAVSHARGALAADNNSLVRALGSYDHERADVAIEVALGSRSVEHAVEEVLLPALEQIIRDQTVDSAAWAFAAPWAADWLRRATRLAPPPVRPRSILVGDASRDELDPDAPYIGALELFCMRAGIKMMNLSARGVAGVRDALAAHRPDLVVLAGGHVADDTVASWTYAVRLAAGPIPIALYRRAHHLTAMPTTGTNQLPSRATDAQQRLLELVETDQTRTTIPPASAASHSNVVTANQRAMPI
jgi:MerR family transcriptional regulator, light-induced transcriptional regulator